MCSLISTIEGWKKVLSDVKGWLLAILVFAICFTYYKGLESPVRVINTYTNNNTALSGDYYRLCRTVQYSRDSALTIDRAFIKNTINGDIYTISLAPLTVTRKEGIYNVCRYILIPDSIEAGEWTIKTYATYNYFVWKHTIEIEDIPIEIKDK